VAENTLCWLLKGLVFYNILKFVWGGGVGVALPRFHIRVIISLIHT